jgi:hypothetical protein
VKTYAVLVKAFVFVDAESVALAEAAAQQVKMTGPVYTSRRRVKDRVCDALRIGEVTVGRPIRVDTNGGAK